MDKQHVEQTNVLERDLSSLGTRFDRHLEIYAKNGKELEAVKTNQLWLMRFFWALMTPTFGGIIYIIFQLK